MLPLRVPVSIAVLLVALTTSGCASTTATKAATVTTVTTPSPSTATPVTTPSPLTAMEIANAFVKAGLPATKVVAQTEGTDPNKFLGRPGKYTERVSFDVPGGDLSGETGDTSRGAVIEFWPSQADAQARADYVQTALKSSPMLGTEYDYVHGSALVRITGDVLPSLAKKFQAALVTMP